MTPHRTTAGAAWQPLTGRRAWLMALVALGLAWGAPAAWATAEPVNALPAPGDVLLLRHATAPGGGDPPGFRLGDCASQRNLDDGGRQQARQLGESLRARGVVVGAVWASPWCRTRETAALAFAGLPVQVQAAFGSFFNDPAQGEPQTRSAHALLQRWHADPARHGVLVVVTHQVNITALTGVVPASGEGVLLRWHGGRWQPAGRWLPP